MNFISLFIPDWAIQTKIEVMGRSALLSFSLRILTNASSNKNMVVFFYFPVWEDENMAMLVAHGTVTFEGFIENHVACEITVFFNANDYFFFRFITLSSYFSNS